MEQFPELIRDAMSEAIGALIAAAIIAFITTAYAGYGLLAAILAAIGAVVFILAVWIVIPLGTIS